MSKKSLLPNKSYHSLSYEKANNINTSINHDDSRLKNDILRFIESEIAQSKKKAIALMRLEIEKEMNTAIKSIQSTMLKNHSPFSGNVQDNSLISGYIGVGQGSGNFPSTQMSFSQHLQNSFGATIGQLGSSLAGIITKSLIRFG